MSSTTTPDTGPAAATGATGAAGAARAGTRRLLGLDFVDDVDLDATVERLLAPQDGEPGEPIVFTPNVDTIVRLGELAPDGIADRLRDARYILPDGQPIVWLSRLLHQPLGARLPGSDLVPPLWRRIVAEGRRAVVVASSEELATRLQAELPSLAVYIPPVFDVRDDRARAAVARAASEVVDRAEPDFVFLGISYPKQQFLAFDLIDDLRRRGRPVPVFLLIGGSFNMYTGHTRRAPAWMQRAGAEWLFRFVLEPRRLFRRYFVDDLRFAPIAAHELRAARAGRRRHPQRRDLRRRDLRRSHPVGSPGRGAVRSSRWRNGGRAPWPDAGRR